MKAPQQLSREAIDEFKAHYKAEFGKLLSDDEVQEIAVQLLRFFGILVNSRAGILESLLRVYHRDGLLPNLLFDLDSLRVGLFLVWLQNGLLYMVEIDISFGHPSLKMDSELETYHSAYFLGNVNLATNKDV